MQKKKKRVTPETALKKAAKDYASYVGMRLWSIMGGLGQEPGIADLIGLYKGRAIAIECKAGSNTLTYHQQQFKLEWEAHGGLFIECRDVRDIAKALGLNTHLW